MDKYDEQCKLQDDLKKIAKRAYETLVLFALGAFVAWVAVQAALD